MDTGIGISEENQRKLFQVFSRISSEADVLLNPQGTGLGLVISNALAKGLGPRDKRGIMMESQENVGSKFSFILLDMSPDE